MYVGDVGGTNEEISFLPRGATAGANLGWNCFSGTAVESGCTPPNYTGPVFQYPSSADVVIGGYVVRDPALPASAGRYLYARFNSGVRLLGPHAAPPDSATSLAIASVSGFGEDGVGHLYVTSLRRRPEPRLAARQGAAHRRRRGARPSGCAARHHGADPAHAREAASACCAAGGPWPTHAAARRARWPPADGCGSASAHCVCAPRATRPRRTAGPG
jgi:hypothetical protein